ncbi:MAG: radical SAM protein [Deltaproteobacteria bacterium]|nr:radical SAM protein [Deltaproteobacteria bacterium]
MGPLARSPPVRVTEIHAAIQGETRHAGRPCALVRLTGCDLRCSYCDTEYAFTGGTEMSVDAVVAEVARLGLALVLVTGGEPLLQRETPQLCQRLLDEGLEVVLETSGAHDVAVLPAGVARVVDVKTPSSGEAGRNRWENLPLLGPRDSLKLVLGDRADYLWALDVIRTRPSNGAEILLSPVLGRLDARDLCSWMLADRVPARLNLQLHKLVYGPDARGV